MSQAILGIEGFNMCDIYHSLVNCPICKISVRQDRLGKHKSKVHGLPKVEMSICPFCNNGVRKDRLYKHIENVHHRLDELVVNIKLTDKQILDTLAEKTSKLQREIVFQMDQACSIEDMFASPEISVTGITVQFKLPKQYWNLVLQSRNGYDNRINGEYALSDTVNKIIKQIIDSAEKKVEILD